MSFRRRSVRPRGRKFREPINWARGTLDGGLVAAGTVDNIPTFNPANFMAGAGVAVVDTRLTMRRLKVNLGVQLFVATAGVVQVDLGIHMSGLNEPVPSPSLLAATDLAADWLYLARYQVRATLAAGESLEQLLGHPIAIDVKSMRKVDTDQVVTLVIATRIPPSSSAVTLTHRAVTEVSVLFSRTSR